MGDPNGIGIELILKALTDKRIFDFCTPIIYGSSRVISFHRKAMDLPEVKMTSLKEGTKINLKGANIINCWEDEVKIELGKPNPEVSTYALKALDAASQDLIDKKIDAVVTGPIDKSLINQVVDEKFVGQTEYFQEKAKSKHSLMIMASEGLKVAIVTGHTPLFEVPKKLNKELILSKLIGLNKSLKEDFGISKPKIAVLGLNPHAGDNGLLGTEEKEIIIPALEAAKQKNIIAIGPYSADGYFGAGLYKKYDAVLAMYHDQGLAPFKALSFDDGVNFTAGLKIVRTSPDHGPAFNLAGKNEASEYSFRASIYTALEIINNRKNHSEYHQDPLDRTALFNGLDGKDNAKEEKKENRNNAEV